MAKNRNRPASRRRRQPARNKPILAAAVGVLIVVLVVTGLVVTRTRSAAGNTGETAPPINRPSLGPAAAVVTISEYADFGCPSCKAWHEAGVLDQILATYGDKVRFEWHDFPVITAQSPKAAEAARCAQDQGKFWEYHDLLFDRAPALAITDLKTYAGEMGIDVPRFSQCLDSGQHTAAVNRDRSDAFGRGLRGTPSFFVNDERLTGGPTAAQLQRLIDPLLAVAH